MKHRQGKGIAVDEAGEGGKKGGTGGNVFCLFSQLEFSDSPSKDPLLASFAQWLAQFGLL